MSSRSRSRFPTAAALILLPLVVVGCVSGARHREIVAERDRIARENFEMRRLLVEQKVRLEEALEALQSRGGGTAADVPHPAPPASPDGGRPAGPAAGDLALPDGLAPAPGVIQDENIRGVAPSGSEPLNDAQGILKVARWYVAAGKTREAQEAYSRLIVDHPFSLLLPEAFLERGRLRLSGGDRKGALADFDTVAEAFPSSPLAPEARREGAALRGR